MERVLDVLRANGATIEERGGELYATCPCHDDQRPTLRIREADDEKVLLTCGAGCRNGSIVTALGLQWRDLFPDHDESPRAKPSANKGKPYERIGSNPRASRTWLYRDEQGQLLYQACRIELPDNDKRFELEKALGDDRWWCGTGCMAGVRRVLYRLPELLASATDPRAIVWLPEGEKCVDRLVAQGEIATTNVGGAEKWRADDVEHLRGRRVVILPDKDEPGARHVRKVASSLVGVAASVKVVELPGLEAKGDDIIDWLNAGRSLAELQQLADATPEWTAPAEQTTRTKRASSELKPPVLIEQDSAAMTAAALEVLGRDANLYQRSRRVVRVVMRDDMPEIDPNLGATEIRERLGRFATWSATKHTRKGGEIIVPAIPPKWIADNVLATDPWPFRELKAIITAPTLRSDGTILDSPGYDPSSCLLFAPQCAFPRIPEHPSDKEVAQALTTLLLPFRDFPFVNQEEDRAALLSSILTVLIRHLMPLAPMHVFRAPTPGSGKTLLVDCISVITTGDKPHTISLPNEEIEADKRILSIGLGGYPLINLDNGSGILGSDALARALTCEEYSGRDLGHSRNATARLTCCWFATGNNLVFRADLPRRIVVIDLDPKCENAEDRDGFAIDELHNYVEENRAELVAAALTLLRAHWVAGLPRHNAPRLGLFTAWDDRVRSCVRWLGMADPRASIERVREEGDADRDALRSVIGTWLRVVGTNELTTAELVERAATNSDLAAALSVVAADRGALSSNRLGQYLGRVKNRIVSVGEDSSAGSCRIVARRTHGSRRWSIDRVQ